MGNKKPPTVRARDESDTKKHLFDLLRLCKPMDRKGESDGAYEMVYLI